MGFRTPCKSLRMPHILYLMGTAAGRPMLTGAQRTIAHIGTLLRRIESSRSKAAVAVAGVDKCPT